MENNNQFENNTKITRNDDIISSEMDDETVMMSIEKGEYYGINAVGSRIWELIEQPNTYGGICEALINEYDVSEKKCRSAVTDFLNYLVEKHIVNLNKVE